MSWDVLELGRDGGGPRLFLAGEPVSTGTLLELLLPGGGAVAVRLEGAADAPTFHLAAGGEWEAKRAAPKCDCAKPQFPRDDEGWPAGPCGACDRPHPDLVFYPAELVCRPEPGGLRSMRFRRPLRRVGGRW